MTNRFNRRLRYSLFDQQVHRRCGCFINRPLNRPLLCECTRAWGIEHRAYRASATRCVEIRFGRSVYDTLSQQRPGLCRTADAVIVILFPTTFPVKAGLQVPKR